MNFKTHTEAVRAYTDILNLSQSVLDKLEVQTSVTLGTVRDLTPDLNRYIGQMSLQLQVLVRQQLDEIHRRTRAEFVRQRDKAAEGLQAEYLEACKQARVDPFTGQPTEVQP